MANSLLAHLYSRIKGSQEDVATIALQYLVSQSDELNRAFTHILENHLDIKLGETLRYSCQVTGSEQERPDMAGQDEAGREVVLCEMKFYAGLTPNQPSTYLDRLRNEGGVGLAFVCPQARMTSLWAKLNELCEDHAVENVKDYCISVDGVRLAIITWAEIIEQLHDVAAASATAYSSDIQQLEGYCAQMDSDAFIPFRSEDLTAEEAKKEERYYRVIDETFDLLCADKNLKASSNGKASTYRTGYQRKLYVGDLLVYLNYDRELWRSDSSVETPFWISFHDAEWQQSGTFLAAISKIPDHKQDASVWDMRFFALEPLQDATLDEVCSDLKSQIMEYIRLMTE